MRVLLGCWVAKSHSSSDRHAIQCNSGLWTILDPVWVPSGHQWVQDPRSVVPPGHPKSPLPHPQKVLKPPKLTPSTVFSDVGQEVWGNLGILLKF